MKNPKQSLFIVVFFCIQLLLCAQESRLLLDKPGKYKMKYYNVYNQNDCNFTKVETSANYQKLLTLTDAIRRNPVLADLKGFDCVASKTSLSCNPLYDYGIPSQIWIDFCSWSLENGKEVCWTDEPPEWSVDVNCLRTFGVSGFNVTTDVPSNPKQGFTVDKWEKAADKVNELFFQPGKKEALFKGIDRYKGESVIIYNPDRPAYWLPVTIREAFALLFDYYRLGPDQTTSESILNILNQEYARFSEAERESIAHFDSGFISDISTDSTGMPLMRLNTAYWNKTLPRSAIQFLSFYCPGDKDYIMNEKAEHLKNNEGTYHVSRFIEALDISILVHIIEK